MTDAMTLGARDTTLHQKVDALPGKVDALTDAVGKLVNASAATTERLDRVVVAGQSKHRTAWQGRNDDQRRLV